jgi:ABC-type multidrug transport system ATPase subunit
MHNSPAIEITQFQKKHQDIAAVHNLNLQVNQGEVFGLIGPDGAGKTTLMRAICTLIKPSTGTILVNGFDVTKDYSKIRQILGYMPQRFSLYHDLTVEQNLQFFADLFQVLPKERVKQLERLYKFSRLQPFNNRLAGALSGGMKQKLALSCALIHTPQILVLDEPTFGVDPVSRKEFWDILKIINGEGTTIFVSTAYMEEAEICDRVALMDRGDIVRIGTPKDIKDDYPFPLYRLTGKNLYHLRQFFLRIDDVKQIQLFGDAIHISFVRKPTEDEWTSWQKQTSHNLQLWEQHLPSMEDVFMDLTLKMQNE